MCQKEGVCVGTWVFGSQGITSVVFLFSLSRILRRMVNCKLTGEFYSEAFVGKKLGLVLSLVL